MIKEYKRRDEFDELGVLAGKIWREHYTPLIGSEQVAYMLDKFQSAEVMFRQITEEGYRYYGIFHEETLAGYCAVKPCKDDASIFLSKLYVALKFRGLGLGKRLLEHAIDECNLPGEVTVWLTVNKGNATTIAVYRKLGFHIADEIVTDIGNGFVMDDYKMEKKIIRSATYDRSLY